MKRSCLYWCCIACFCGPASAADVSDVIAAINASTQSPLERRVSNIESLLERFARKYVEQNYPTTPAKPKTADDYPPSPKLSQPVVTFRTETRYRSVPYTVKVCPPGQPCRYETRWYSQAYPVQVPVASSQYVLPGESQPEAASTPMPEVVTGIGLLGLKRGSVLCDPGCGADARVLIEAARRYGCSGIGFEIDAARAESAQRAVDASGFGKQIRIVHGDASQYVIDADAVYCYLYPRDMEKIQRKLTARVKKIASYMHKIDRLAMQRHGNFYVWTRSVPEFRYNVPSVRMSYPYPVASPVPGCRCPMCRQNRALGL